MPVCGRGRSPTGFDIKNDELYIKNDAFNTNAQADREELKGLLKVICGPNLMDSVFKTMVFV